MYTLILFSSLSILVVVLLGKGIRIVKQSEAMLIERLGKYHRTLESGINIVIPVIDRPRQINWRYTETGFNGEIISVFKLQDRIDLRENVYDFPKQNVITRDNVVTEINALIYFQIIDPLKSVYEIGNLPNAIEKLTQTTLRNVVGEMDLDQCLSSRDTINAKLRAILDDATNKWGVKVNRVELQDINPPLAIRDAMEKQMRAERTRRATILEAEGEKGSQILTAEGQRESDIQRAEGQKQSAILEAEGQAQARIRVAQAEAEAIRLVSEAVKGYAGDPVQYLI
ncbi:MAG: hypothetical protein RL558_858, partial [Bacteroidota bacterium]